MLRRIGLTTSSLALLAGSLAAGCVLPGYDEAPTPTPWSRTMGGIGDDRALAVASAPRGQVIVAGRYGGYLSLDDDRTNLQPLDGGVDAFVARYDEYGAPLWSKTLGQAGIDEITSAAVAPDGRVLLAGHINVTPYLDTPTELGPQRGFVAALDGDTGDILWQRVFHDDSARWGIGIGGVSVDASGNALVTGTWAGTFLLEPEERPFLLENDVGCNAFVLKLGPGGELLWGRDIEDGSHARGLAITTDSDGEVLLTGYHQGAAALGGPDPLPTPPATALFVAKYSADNVFAWGQSFPCTGDGVTACGSAGTAITIDPTDSILVAGHATGPIALGGDPLVPADDHDALLLKLGPPGNLVWSTLLDASQGTAGGDAARSIRVSPDGALVLAGNIVQTYDDGTGTLITDTDMFLARLDPSSGAAQGLTRFGGEQEQRLSGMAVTPERDVLLAGWFQDNLDLGAGPLPKYRELDIFVARVAPP